MINEKESTHAKKLSYKVYVSLQISFAPSLYMTISTWLAERPLPPTVAVQNEWSSKK